MKFHFNENHAGMLLDCLDISIKETGIRGVYTHAGLAHAVNNPVEQGEGYFVMELTDEQIQQMATVLDRAVKFVGLNGAANVLALSGILANPIPEEAPAAEEAPEDAPEVDGGNSLISASLSQL